MDGSKRRPLIVTQFASGPSTSTPEHHNLDCKFSTRKDRFIINDSKGPFQTKGVDPFVIIGVSYKTTRKVETHSLLLRQTPIPISSLC